MMPRDLSDHGFFMLCADVDGTLIDSNGKLFEDAKALFEAVGSRFLASLCSARPFASLVRLAKQLQNIHFLAGSQGALVARRCNFSHQLTGRTSDWEILATCWLKGEEVSSVLEISDKYKVEAWFHGDHHWYVSRLTRAVGDEERMIHLAPRVYGRGEELAVLKAVLVAEPCRSCQEMDSLVADLRGAQLNATQSRPGYVEVVSLRSSPCKGADLIAKAASVDKKRVIAVGDSSNDGGMLKFAGYPFTFRGAPKGLLGAGAFELATPSDGGLRELSTWIDDMLKTGG